MTNFTEMVESTIAWCADSPDAKAQREDSEQSLSEFILEELVRVCENSDWIPDHDTLEAVAREPSFENRVQFALEAKVLAHGEIDSDSEWMGAILTSCYTDEDVRTARDRFRGFRGTVEDRMTSLLLSIHSYRIW